MWRAILGIFCIALSLFLVLSALSLGGVVGNVVFSYVSFLLGIGYALLPLSLAFLAVVLLRNRDATGFRVVQIIGVGIFLLATLALINIGAEGRAGTVGTLVAKPFLYAFDTIASILFLCALSFASLVVIFDFHPAQIMEWIRCKIASIRDDSTAEEEIEPLIDENALVGEAFEEENLEDTTETDEIESEIPEEETEKEKKSSILSFLDKEREDEEGAAPIISASGVVYTPPPVALLSKNKGKPEVGDIKANANIIKRTLQNFGIEVEMDEVSIGPTVTRYALKPAEGVRLAKIVALQSNLELALAASPVRIEAPIPGKALVGIEVPNTSRTTLGLAPMVSDKEYETSDKPLLAALGRSISGSAHFADVAKMPHMLIAGATGSGKSVTIHDFVVSLLYRCGPEQLRFVMVDPKRVELTLYNSIPHLLTPVITDPKRAILALKWLAKEMDRRYDVLETEKVRDISSYHKNILAPALERERSEDEALPEAMPYIVLIIDELADIMQTYPRELEAGIVRLAQMSRAVGIHLILSTQRPSVKVITGLIKANIPARVALQVASQIDSRTILDMGGAEKLLGAGDMLFLSGEMSKPRRMQAPFISEDEVKSVVKWLSKNYEHTLPHEIDFTESNTESSGIFAGSIDDGGEDDLYEDARQAVMEAGKASTSYLQRKLRIGYSRAARLMDILEERGVIGAADGSKPRDVISPSGDGTDTSDEEEKT